MRGQVLGVDPNSGEGQIAGDDGRRYSFRPADWSDRNGPAVGALVDFEAQDARALRIYHLPAAIGGTSTPALHQSSAATLNDRNKIVAALLAFFLGVLGVHRFYLGRTGSGVIMLILTVTIIGLAVTGLWAFIDFVRLLLMSDDDFAARYRQD